jgi:Tfp pilus assembly protein PilN
MRPVNLIPPDLRRGDHAPLRTGPVAYIVLGALALVLLGVTVLVLTGNEISDRKAQVATLQREDAAASARAERLAAYTQFQALTEQRIATVTSLADSRFDWERVMRELALILPDDVWLVSFNASAGPSGGAEGEGGGGNLGSSVQGPSLELSGCAAGQDGVAGFVTALRDIDGVTRVGLESSAVGQGTGGSVDGGEGCQTRDFIAQFSLVVAFDAAPAPVGGSETEVAPVAEATETASAEGDEEAGGEG